MPAAKQRKQKFDLLRGMRQTGHNLIPGTTTARLIKQTSARPETLRPGAERTNRLPPPSFETTPSLGGDGPPPGPRPKADGGATSPRLKARVPLFEITLLVVLLALGWATFRTYTALNEFNRRTPPAPAVPEVEEAAEIPEPVEPPESKPQNPQDIQEILRLSALLDTKDRYTDLADQLEPGLAELRNALQGYLRDKDRAEIARYRQKSRALDAWLRKQQADVDARKLQSLRDWLAGLPPTNSPAVVVNLDQLLGLAQFAFSNYLAAVPLAEGQPLSPDLVQQKLARAAEPEQDLLVLSRQLRAQAAAIDTFVKQRQQATTPPPPAPKIVKVPRPVRLVGDGGAAAIAAFDRLVGDIRAAFQPLFYVLVTTLIVQSALLIVSLYTRMIVIPLRQKLIENNTAIEHQKKLTHFARLATGLAHEIRNPLTAINVRLFTLQKSMSKGTSEHSDAALIRNEIDRLEQILKDFLKLARPSEPRFTPLTAEPVLREMHDLFTPQLKRLSIALKMDAMSPVQFLADPLQLKQVLINLIQNAADSIGSRGTITLRARGADSRLSGRPVKAVVLEIQDTGSGIPPEVQERLFDPFFSTKDNGTGLGLAIAAKIIDQHKGTLDFETQLGHGTVFRIVLPASVQ
jgi:signal transduction histidine kinase